MMIFKKLLVLALIAICFGAQSQQRAITSTYQYNQLLLNPAYAGSLNIFSAIAVHRKQWINLSGAPEYSSVSAHSSFLGNQIGAGFHASRDLVGPTDDISLYGSYAYKIKTKLGILAMGLSAGFNNRKNDYTQLSIVDQSDPYLTRNESRFAPNFGTGVYFANPVFYAGFSIPYLLENKTLDIAEITTSNEESRESRNYYFTSGLIIPLAPSIKLSPAKIGRASCRERV